jgi:hypothetical protein
MDGKLLRKKTPRLRFLIKDRTGCSDITGIWWRMGN